MKKLTRICSVLIAVQCIAQNFKEISSNFGKRVYDHVLRLSEFGTRSAGSAAAENIITYLKEQFSDMQMNLEIDTFYYTWMNLKNRQLTLNGETLRVQTFYVNKSFPDTVNLIGECYVIRSPGTDSLKIKDKIVLTHKSNHVILLKKYSPKAIIV